MRAIRPLLRPKVWLESGMTNETRRGSDAKDGRDKRLAAALKANLGRRKAQTRARSARDEAGGVSRSESVKESG